MSNKGIKFDILKIDSQIKSNQKYEEEGNRFEYCKEYNQDNQSDDDEGPKYIAKINSNTYKYLGILSKYLKKESFGYNCYINGDEYFGQWNKDKKEGFGIYFYKEGGSDPINQIYIGEFKNNTKSGEGIFFNIFKIDIEEDLSIPIDFSLAVGHFSENNFNKGIIYTIKNGKRRIYKGKLNKEGQKNDDKAEYYEEDNKIFHGIFKENNMIEGRIIITKGVGKEAGYYFKKNGEEEKDIDFDFEKGEKDDVKYINKFDKLNETFDYEKIKDLFVSILMIRIKSNASNNFDYIKNLNFDVDIKQKLKGQYGKYLNC